MPVTQRQLHSDLAKISQESLSEHSKFSTGDLSIMSRGNIFPPPTPANKTTEKFVAEFNKMDLDLSKHPTANELVNLPQESVDNLAGGLNRHDLLEHPIANGLGNLPDHQVFNDFASFHHAVANTSDGPRILHTLIEFMKHDVGMAGEYTK